MCYTLFSAVSTVTELDKDGDGIADTTTEATTKPDGTVVTTVHTDSNDDGIQDEVTIVTQEPGNGAKTTSTGTIVNHSDGTQTITLVKDKFSDNGCLTNEIQTLNENGLVTKTEYDFDRDGRADQIIYYEHDTDGNVVKESLDRYALGNIDTVNRYEDFNENGQARVRQLDRDADAKIDYISYSTYDEMGRVTRVDIDQNADGRINETNLYSDFNAQNRALTVSVDKDRDVSTIERIIHRTYDDEGRLLSWGSDNDGSGDKMDYVTHYSEFTPCGKAQLFELDRGDDGNINSRTKTTYDKYGRAVEQLLDQDGDNTYERRIETHYDNYGRRIAWNSDENNDGTIDQGNYYKDFDAFDKATVIFKDKGDDGKVESIQYKESSIGSLELDSYEGFSYEDLSTIWLSQKNSTVLTISDDVLNSIAGDTLTIRSSTKDDVLKLSQEIIDTKVEGDTNPDTYTIGDLSIVVDPDIIVIAG
ncbi:hypothetical protein [Pasteurella atlantica]|uniref:hypothetical protein n=1 Tax=Pasteurella atlantica TaxID=2827233 RepID=UPI0027518E0C|nr:hypothetical protein [Pasteurella atlantica]MDP8106042.1 hypothetical protein [Pasteurella atlantica]